MDFKKGPCHPVEFKKRPCRMSLKPKNGCVALSILGVYSNPINRSLIMYLLTECTPQSVSTMPFSHSMDLILIGKV